MIAAIKLINIMIKKGIIIICIPVNKIEADYKFWQLIKLDFDIPIKKNIIQITPSIGTTKNKNRNTILKIILIN